MCCQLVNGYEFESPAFVYCVRKFLLLILNIFAHYMLEAPATQQLRNSARQTGHSLNLKYDPKTGVGNVCFSAIKFHFSTDCCQLQLQILLLQHCLL